jgi:sugar lactone lactonase YvrE
MSESVYLAEPMLRRVSKVDLAQGRYEVLSGILWQKNFVDLAVAADGDICALEATDHGVHRLRVLEDGSYAQVGYNRVTDDVRWKDTVALAVTPEDRYLVVDSSFADPQVGGGIIVQVDPATGQAEQVGAIEDPGRLTAILSEGNGSYIITSSTRIYRWHPDLAWGEAELIADLSQARDGVSMGKLTDAAFDNDGRLLVSGHTLQNGRSGYPSIARIDTASGARELLITDPLWHHRLLVEYIDVPDVEGVNADDLRSLETLFDFNALTIRSVAADARGGITFSIFWSNIGSLRIPAPGQPHDPRMDLFRFGLSLITAEAVSSLDPANGDIRVICGSWHATLDEEEPRLLDPHGILFLGGSIILADLNTIKEIPEGGDDFSERYYESRGTGPIFGRPESIAMNPSNGMLYVTDRYYDAVFRVDPRNGDRTVVSGSGAPPYLVGQGPALQAPSDIKAARGGRLFVTTRHIPGEEGEEGTPGAVYSIRTTGARTVVSAPGVTPGYEWLDPHWLTVDPWNGLLAVAEERVGPWQADVDQGGICYVTLANGSREHLEWSPQGLLAYGPAGDLYFPNGSELYKDPEHEPLPILVSGSRLGGTLGNGPSLGAGEPRDLESDAAGSLYFLKDNMSRAAVGCTIGRSQHPTERERILFRIDPATGDRSVAYDFHNAGRQDGYYPMPDSVALSSQPYQPLRISSASPNLINVNRLNQAQRAAFDITIRGSGFPDGLSVDNLRVYVSGSMLLLHPSLRPLRIRRVSGGEIVLTVSVSPNYPVFRYADISLSVPWTGETVRLTRAVELQYLLQLP